MKLASSKKTHRVGGLETFMGSVAKDPVEGRKSGLVKRDGSVSIRFSCHTPDMFPIMLFVMSGAKFGLLLKKIELSKRREPISALLNIGLFFIATPAFLNSIMIIFTISGISSTS